MAPSLLNNYQSGAAFVISLLKVEHRYHVGKAFVGLYYKTNCWSDGSKLPLQISSSHFSSAFCVYSKSVLHAQKNLIMKVRGDIIVEIGHIIHFLILQGTTVDFVGYHRTAEPFLMNMLINWPKNGATNSKRSEIFNIPFSLQRYQYEFCITKDKQQRKKSFISPTIHE